MVVRIRNNNYTNRLIKLLVMASDFVVLWALLLVTVRFIPNSETWSEGTKRVFMMVCMVAMLIAEWRFPTVIHERVVGANDILQRCTFLVMTQMLLSYLMLRAIHFTFQLGWQLFCAAIVMLLILILLRFMERWILKCLRQKGYNTRSVTLVGSDRELQRVYHKLVSNASYGYRVSSNYGYIEGLHSDGTVGDFETLLSHPESLHLGDEVYLCVSSKERDLIVRTASVCNHSMSKFYYVPVAEEKLGLQTLLVDDIEVQTTYTSPLEDPLNRIFKRLMDIFLSVLFLIPTALLMPVIALIVKRQSPGPLFFRQLRTGLDGHDFYCYKFRSMHVNSDADRLQATKDDPRKFPFGDFMRKTNIDELPQFWNVLIGNMSIVGPRPHMLAHTEQYDKLIDKYMVRHFVKPGVTGWAQVTGFRGETRELWQMEGRVERDIWYIQHWSFWLDLRIIWMTVKTVFKRDEKAY